MARRTKAAAPGAPGAPAGIAAGAPVVPAGTPAPPAPTQEQDARSPLRRATGTDNTALQCTLLRDLLAVLAVKPGSESSEQRGAAAFGLLKAFKVA